MGARLVVAIVVVAAHACVPPGPTPGAFVGPQPHGAAAPGPAATAEAGPAQPDPTDPYAAEPAGQAAPATAAGNLDDVTFAAPAGWSTQRADGYATITGPGCVLHLIAPAASGADLDTTLEAVFWKFFDGHTPMNHERYDLVATGTSAAGWRYRRLETQLRSTRAGADGRMQHYNALGFGADLGGKTAVVLGVADLGSRCFIDHWPAFFHSLAFAGHADRADALRDALIGTWRSGGGDRMMQFSFAGNGRYELGGGFASEQLVSTTTALRTTTSFVGDGTWELRGRELVTRSDKPGATPSSAWIRIEVEEHHGRREEYLYRLQRGADGVVFEAGLRRVEP